MKIKIKEGNTYSPLQLKFTEEVYDPLKYGIKPSIILGEFDGKRCFLINSRLDYTICFSKEEVLKILSNYIKEDFEGFIKNEET